VRLLWAAAVRNRERRSLVGLKRDLLRQHDVTKRKMSFGLEAPDGHPRATLVELFDVHLSIPVDAIAFAAIAAHDLKMPRALVLLELCWRKPLPEQGACFLISFPPRIARRPQ
jgi:hypothetical protein